MGFRWYEGVWCSEAEAEARSNSKLKLTLLVGLLSFGIYLIFNGSVIIGSCLAAIFTLVYWRFILFLLIIAGLLFLTLFTIGKLS